MPDFLRTLLASVMALACLGVAVAEDEVVVFVKPRSVPIDVTPRVAMSECGLWTGFYGPIDYRSAAGPTRRRVESVHFDEYVPQYLAWANNKPFDRYIAANFGYTLRAFPNHPTALLLMEQIGRRLRTDAIPGSYYPLECWYVRGLQAVPSDPMVRAHYGIYLAFRGRDEEARRNLDIGDRGLCWSRTMQYEIGLANLKLDAFELAQKNAMRAERMGLALPYLKKQLTDAGRWDDSIRLPPEATLDCDLSDPGHSDKTASDAPK